MDVTLCFDVEDYTSPIEAGMDDIPKWNAEIMTEEGVRGSFLVIGGKARSLRQRERHDVIAAMRKHEIGVHTMYGSEHPTMTEAMAPLEWNDAVQLGIEREGQCYRDLKDIFQVEPGSFSSHGASQVPAMHYVAGTHYKRPWLYSFVPCGTDGFCWYSNCLQLRWEGIHFNEAAYSNPKAVDEILARWEKKVDEMVAKGVKWSNVFMAHPLMIRAKQFNDGLNFPDGKNRLPWITPELRTLEEMEIAKQQFRRVVQWLAKHPKLNIITLYETQQKHGARKPSISKDELKVYAEHARESGGIPTGYPFSPADATMALAQDIKAGVAAERNVIADVQGPTAEPTRAPENVFAWLGVDEIKHLAQAVIDVSAKTNHLPAAVAAPNGARMGLPAVTRILVDAWMQMTAKKEQRVQVSHLTCRYPEGTMEIDSNARKAWLGWPIHDINMPLENLSRQARLQTWTWKRAWDGGENARRYEPIKRETPVD